MRNGSKYWFEYHCYESDKSADAALWYHSHQRATILQQIEPGYGKTMKARLENGEPAVYRIKFNDEFIADAFEDELMVTKKHFCRPNPPTNT
jgi:hypothetical protein